MGVCSIAGDVADDAELARWRLEALFGDEGWDWVGEVYAIHEDLRSSQSGAVM